ncbi:MAG: hypothetical protein IKM73_08240 [Acidaminococcaceae bacterium]|nr:hypothetical protein [Acidaminococcaceae bacterium]
MELTEFKDILFDLINESDDLSIINIAWNETDNLFVVQLSDLSQFVVQVKPAKALTEKERSGLVGLSESVSSFALGEAEQSLKDALNVHRKGKPVITLVPPKEET